MTTAADLIEETRRYLMSGSRENMNTLNGALDNAQTTVAFTYDLDQIQAGSYISIDLEIMYVWSVPASGTSGVTVQRGVLGTTAAAHADDSLVFVNPKFPAFSIFQALNADLDALASPQNGLYQTAHVEFNYNPAIMGYDLGVTAFNVFDILMVRYQVPGPSNDWIPVRNYRFEVDADTTSYSSGFGITLFEGGYPGLPVRVTYSTPFTHFVALTDNATATGLPVTAVDLPPLGAGMRLAGVREVQRNFNESQGDTRRASEVPPNAQLAGMTSLMRLRQQRIAEEASKLSSTWPVRRKGL